MKQEQIDDLLDRAKKAGWIRERDLDKRLRFRTQTGKFEWIDPVLEQVSTGFFFLH